MSEHERTEVLYENPLSSPEDVADWTLEGNAAITFPRGRMRIENVDDPDEVDEPHYVHWCPRRFPDGVAVSWKFWPLYEPGLCMLFFAARGRDGESALDPSLDERTGIYSQYFDGDIDTLHVSYFRRNEHGDPKHEVAFQTVNLRKSKGFRSSGGRTTASTARSSAAATSGSGRWLRPSASTLISPSPPSSSAGNRRADGEHCRLRVRRRRRLPGRSPRCRNDT
jgi:hypothetical protein